MSLPGGTTSTTGYAVDDLISEFLTETAESLEVVDSELVKFEANPTERKTLDNIFRLVHTVKGTCGFLGCRASKPWPTPAKPCLAASVTASWK